VSDQKAARGRIVTYTLGQADADAINGRSQSNFASAGDEYPALIVRVWTDDCVNLQVFYDGEGSLWCTSRVRGPGLSHWEWPARV
jgi:hypothetical protein